MLVDTRPPPPAADDQPVGSPTGWLAVGVAGLGGALLAGRAVSYQPGACLARTHLGFACPACGFTHLADHLLHGRVGSALVADGAGTLLLVLLAVTAVAQLVAWRRGRPVAALRHRALPIALGALLATHWALTLATGGATA